jgi:hypothetical protein
MKYNVGDRVRAFNVPSLKRLVASEIGCNRDVFVIKAAWICEFKDKHNNQCNSCSGNVYSFIGDLCEGSEGWCRVEEQSELYKWKPRKPKNFTFNLESGC